MAGIAAAQTPAGTGSLLEFDPRSFPGFRHIFGNDNPVEIEIGCGKGKFLIARAMEHPEINFLGIDVSWKWMKYGVQRSDRRGLRNVRFAKKDAREVVARAIPDGSVSAFHIYFPDPWPKRRHHKRRLITGAFLALTARRLAESGIIELATDHDDYFMQMRLAVVQSGVAWRTTEETTNDRLFAAGARTNYELKYESAGRTLHYLELVK
ncbi:MAG: tRNA (guanosine(46)-N7)-methyltransferase TrmB [Candidatus Krumholzibacteriia bacterium]